MNGDPEYYPPKYITQFSAEELDVQVAVYRAIANSPHRRLSLQQLYKILGNVQRRVVLEAAWRLIGDGRVQLGSDLNLEFVW